MENSRRNFIQQIVGGATAAAVGTTIPALATIPAIAPGSPSMLIDNRAILGRAGYAIDLLRTKYVCEGWHEGFDEDGAARALRYFTFVAEHGDHEEDELEMEEFSAALDFLDSHGINLDWIFRGDIGGMIADGASNSARAAAIQSAA